MPYDELETALLFSESYRGPYVQRIAVSGVGRKPILLQGSDGPVHTAHSLAFTPIILRPWIELYSTHLPV